MSLISATSASALYETSHIKRIRATRASMEERREGLLAILVEQQPMTVRQVFYQATVRGLIEKTEAGYGKVQRALVEMRREGLIPYDWLADNTRLMRKPRTYRGIEHMLKATERLYRRDLWQHADAYCELWL